MNSFKSLIMLAAIFLFATAAFGQQLPTPADQYGPRRDGVSGGRPVTEGSIPPNKPDIKIHLELEINQKLEGKLKTMLPQNLSPKAAAVGFFDLRDFVTTVRVANNLSIPFPELKHTMANGSSKELEKAIHKLKPDAAAQEEIKKAKDQAKKDIKESERS